MEGIAFLKRYNKKDIRALLQKDHELEADQRKDGQTELGINW